MNFELACELDQMISGFSSELLLFCESKLSSFVSLFHSILQEDSSKMLELQKQEHEKLCLDTLFSRFQKNANRPKEDISGRVHVPNLMRFDRAITRFLALDAFKTRNSGMYQRSLQPSLMKTCTESSVGRGSWTTLSKSGSDESGMIKNDLCAKSGRKSVQSNRGTSDDIILIRTYNSEMWILYID